MDIPSPSTNSESAIDFRSDQEERLNFLTHALGFVLALVGFYFLIPAIQGKSHFVRFVTWVYGVNMFALYACSALSHYYHRSKFRDLFRRMDQALIFTFIIAGFTPYFAVHMTESWAWFGMAILWLLAFAGFSSKLFFGHRIEGIATWTYLALGWLPVIGIPFAKSLPLSVTGFIVGGGIVYMIGIAFLLADHKRWFFHGIWHLFVIIGTAVHYVGIRISLAS